MSGWQVLGWIVLGDLGIVSTMLAVALGLVFVRSASNSTRRSDYREKR